MHPFSPKLRPIQHKSDFLCYRYPENTCWDLLRAPSLSFWGYMGMEMVAAWLKWHVWRKGDFRDQVSKDKQSKACADILPRVGIEALSSPLCCVPFSCKSLLSSRNFGDRPVSYWFLYQSLTGLLRYEKFMYRDRWFDGTSVKWTYHQVVILLINHSI